MNIDVHDAEPCEQISIDEKPFFYRWSKLTSDTNWQKGRIICEWRAELIDAGLPTAEYSDQAWADKVGGVTGQHVGRLRRTTERFGVFEDGLLLTWSHYNAALEWEDASDWLSQANNERWSVSQMRAARWEAIGGDEEEELDAATREGQQAGHEAAAAEDLEGEPAAEHSRETEAVEEPDPAENLAPLPMGTGDDFEAESDVNTGPAEIDTYSLPDDVADAFEQFKLVILSHKLTDWDAMPHRRMVSTLEKLVDLCGPEH